MNWKLVEVWDWFWKPKRRLRTKTIKFEMWVHITSCQNWTQDQSIDIVKNKNAIIELIMNQVSIELYFYQWCRRSHVAKTLENGRICTKQKRKIQSKMSESVRIPIHNNDILLVAFISQSTKTMWPSKTKYHIFYTFRWQPGITNLF